MPGQLSIPCVSGDTMKTHYLTHLTLLTTFPLIANPAFFFLKLFYLFLNPEI